MVFAGENRKEKPKNKIKNNIDKNIVFWYNR
jgi:hypothetical protein